MESKEIWPRRFRHTLGWAGGATLVAAMLISGTVAAQGNRGGGWLRSYPPPHERPLREAPALAPEAPRRVDAEDGRNPRRWSSEERLQLRRDVHEAGRDVYGNPPRRSH